MLNKVFYLKTNSKYIIGSVGLDESNGKLIEDLKTLKTCGEILISHPN